MTPNHLIPVIIRLINEGSYDEADHALLLLRETSITAEDVVITHFLQDLKAAAIDDRNALLKLRHSDYPFFLKIREREGKDIDLFLILLIEHLDVSVFESLLHKIFFDPRLFSATTFLLVKELFEEHKLVEIWRNSKKANHYFDLLNMYSEIQTDFPHFSRSDEEILLNSALQDLESSEKWAGEIAMSAPITKASYYRLSLKDRLLNFVDILTEFTASTSLAASTSSISFVGFLRLFGGKKRMERYTAVNFPHTCQINSKTLLSVQITVDRPKKAAFVGMMAAFIPVAAKNFEIEVHISSPAFAIQEYRKTMVVSLSGDSEEITFILFPVESGVKSVDVEFFHEGLRVGYILAETTVTDLSAKSFVSRPAGDQSVPTGEAAKAYIFHNPADSISGLKSNSIIDSKRKLIHIASLGSETEVVRFTLYEGSDKPSFEQTITLAKREQIEHDITDLNDFLSRLIKIGDPTDTRWEDINITMKGKGGTLFELLIPDGLRTRVAAWSNDTIIQISTDENWIPWELIHDKNDFWGRKFILARLPRKDSQVNKIPETSISENIDPGSNERKLAVNVIGGGIGAKEKINAESLFKQLPAPPWSVANVIEKTISELLKATRNSELLHFTCHGHTKPYILQIAKESEDYRNLMPETVKELGFTQGKALIFANACSSDFAVLTFGKFTSFGWEFCSSGARTFIGTLGSIPQEYALKFAETFYEELFRSPNVTVGEALKRAKHKSCKERNLFWLFYCLYGDPYYSLKIEGNN